MSKPYVSRSDTSNHDPRRLRAWRKPAHIWQGILVCLGGALNPVVYLSWVFDPLDLGSRPFGSLIGNFSVIDARGVSPSQQAILLVGPVILMALIAVRRLRHRTASSSQDIVRDWLVGLVWAILLAPLLFAIQQVWALDTGEFDFIGADRIEQRWNNFISLLTLLIVVLALTVMSFLAGWSAALIPILAITVGIPAMAVGIIATLCVMPPNTCAEQQDTPDVPTP